MHFIIPVEEVRRIVAKYLPDDSKTAALGTFVHQQTKERFATQGASGGESWAPKRVKDWGHDDSRAVLTGASATLLDQFFSYSDRRSATLANTAPYSHVHQKGTVGKGGELPTIVPRFKKMLYVPLTDRARPGWRKDWVRGRFVNGKVEPQNADYVLIRKADIPPRRMLPTSPNEIQAQVEFYLDICRES